MEVGAGTGTGTGTGQPPLKPTTSGWLTHHQNDTMQHHLLLTAASWHTDLLQSRSVATVLPAASVVVATFALGAQLMQRPTINQHQSTFTKHATGITIQTAKMRQRQWWLVIHDGVVVVGMGVGAGAGGWCCYKKSYW